MTPYLKSISIQNLGGIKNLKADLSPVTVIVADNHKGKSSILSSIATVFEGGSDPDLLRTGAAKGSVEIEFGNGYRAVKEIKPTGYKLEVTDPAGGSIAAAATKVKEWVPKDGFDIRELIRMVLHDSKELEKFLLEHLPLNFDVKEINEALGGVTRVLQPMTLPQLNAQRKSLYDQRTETTRDVKTLTGAIETNERNVGEADPTDWSTERNRLTTEIASIDGRIKTTRLEIRSKADGFIATERSRIEAEIQKLREELSAYERDAEIEVASVTADRVGSLEAERAELAEQLGTVTGRATAQTMAAGVRQNIEEEKTRLEGHVTKVTRLSMALEDIDKLKARKLKELPVDGLDIKQNGKETIITVNDVPLHKLSGQEQIFLVVRFVSAAQKASGCEMRLIVCEGAELSEKYLVELGEACQDAEIQLIVTMRQAGAELQVLSLDEYRTMVAVAA